MPRRPAYPCCILALLGPPACGGSAFTAASAVDGGVGDAGAADGGVDAVPPDASAVTALQGLAMGPSLCNNNCGKPGDNTLADLGSVLAIPFAGGPPIVLAEGEPSPFGIAVDDTNVYWTNGTGAVRAIHVPAHP